MAWAEWKEGYHLGKEGRRYFAAWAQGRWRLLPGQGRLVLLGQEGWMRGCWVSWQAFLLTQTEEALFRIPRMSAPAGRTLVFTLLV